MHTTTSVRTVLCSSRREITLISLRLTVPNRQVMGPRRMSCGTGLTPSNSSYSSTVFHLMEKVVTGLGAMHHPLPVYQSSANNDSTETPPRRNLLLHLLHLTYHDGSNLSKEQPLRRRLPFRVAGLILGDMYRYLVKCCTVDVAS